jgi:hypothetical protein
MANVTEVVVKVNGQEWAEFWAELEADRMRQLRARAARDDRWDETSRELEGVSWCVVTEDGLVREEDAEELGMEVDGLERELVDETFDVNEMHRRWSEDRPHEENRQRGLRHGPNDWRPEEEEVRSVWQEAADVLARIELADYLEELTFSRRRLRRMEKHLPLVYWRIMAELFVKANELSREWGPRNYPG